MTDLTTSSNQAYQSLRERILNLKLAPGRKIKEEQMAREMRISRTPVREALRRLEKEGLVECKPRRGSYVRQFSLEEIMEIYDLREILEKWIIHLVSDLLTPADIKELFRIVKDTESIARKRDYLQFIDKDLEFHQFLSSKTNNQTLQHITEMLHLQTKVFRIYSMIFPSAEKIKRAVKDHQEIIEALRLHNVSLAERLMQEHIRTGKRNTHTYYRSNKNYLQKSK